MTFDHPPINAITATTVADLTELVTLIEHDRDLNVVVFDSANPNFFLGDYDDAGPAWRTLLVRLSRAPVVSIASVRGRAGRAGSEFMFACDLRFAARDSVLVDSVASLLADLDHATLTRGKANVVADVRGVR